MGRNTITVNDYLLAYQQCGKGATLILVHGSLGDYRSWAPQLTFFSDHFRTVALSLRHCYPEIWDGEGSDFTVHQHADDLAGFIRKLDLGPVHLVGHSRGGAVVLKMITACPDLYRTAVLADPAPFRQLLGDDSDALAALDKRNRFIRAAVKRMRAANPDEGLEIFSDAVTAPGTWRKLPQAARQMRRDNAWSLTSLIDDAREPFGCADARKIKNPVLLTTGERSPRIYAMMHARLKVCLPNWQTAVIRNASHGMHRDNPDMFNKVVLDFLQRHGA